MRLFMEKCPECEQENYAAAVSSGQCVWCGYKATKKDIGDHIWFYNPKKEVTTMACKTKGKKPPKK